MNTIEQIKFLEKRNIEIYVIRVIVYLNTIARVPLKYVAKPLASFVHLTMSACVNLSNKVVPDWCGAGLPERISPSLPLHEDPHIIAASTAGQSPKQINCVIYLPVAQNILVHSVYRRIKTCSDCI